MIHEDLEMEKSKDGSPQLNPGQGLTTTFVNVRIDDKRWPGKGCGRLGG